MAKIRIVSSSLSYKNHLYGPGEMLEVTEEKAAELLMRLEGEIEAVEEENQNQAKKEPQKQSSKTIKNKTRQNSKMKLPDADISATVQK